MDCNDIKPGLRVMVTALESTKGMTIHSKHLHPRALGVVGTVKSYVPGHGGDVWFVQHDHSTYVGAYRFTELTPAEPGRGQQNDSSANCAPKKAIPAEVEELIACVLQAAATSNRQQLAANPDYWAQQLREMAGAARLAIERLAQPNVSKGHE